MAYIRGVLFCTTGKRLSGCWAVHLASQVDPMSIRAPSFYFRFILVSSANDEYLWDFIGSLTWQSWWLTNSCLQSSEFHCCWSLVSRPGAKLTKTKWFFVYNPAGQMPLLCNRRKNPLKDPFNHPSTLCDHHRLLGKQSLSRSRTASVFWHMATPSRRSAPKTRHLVIKTTGWKLLS